MAKKIEELEKELKVLEEEEQAKELQKKIDDLKNKDKFVLSDGTEVKMRKPKARDVRKSQTETKNEAEVEITLIADLTGLTKEEIDNLDMDDYEVYQRKLATFFSVHGMI
ncbi:phage tail assembly protein [Poseidonibacter lekithochrous]|uniref:phage tail assembly protein n=1 Tax=Poseidonibacter lekithochrous TaxID=1904463 RepID=UPI000D381B68|nr:phage tail assembly protein [Poseidonibacter lekithochrous]